MRLNDKTSKSTVKTFRNEEFKTFGKKYCQSHEKQLATIRAINYVLLCPISNQSDLSLMVPSNKTTDNFKIGQNLKFSNIL